MSNQSGRAGVAPSLAPMPDMQCCAWCHGLAAGYQRAGGSFVCSECWAEHIDRCPVEHTQEPEERPGTLIDLGQLQAWFDLVIRGVLTA